MTTATFRKTGGPPQRAVVHDVSRGGCFLATALKCPVGTSLEVEFKLPSGHTLKSSGRVAWVRARGEGTAPAGMGIEFTTIDEASLAAIDELGPAQAPKIEEVAAGRGEKSEPAAAEPKPKPAVPPRPPSAAKPKSAKATLVGIPPPLVLPAQPKEAAPPAPVPTEPAAVASPPPPPEKPVEPPRAAVSDPPIAIEELPEDAVVVPPAPALPSVDVATSAPQPAPPVEPEAVGASASHEPPSRRENPRYNLPSKRSSLRLWMALPVVAVVLGGGGWLLGRHTTRSPAPTATIQAASSPAPTPTPEPTAVVSSPAEQVQPPVPSASVLPAPRPAQSAATKRAVPHQPAAPSKHKGGSRTHPKPKSTEPLTL